MRVFVMLKKSIGVVLLAVTALTGCGDESSGDKKETQVVAKVNGTEVTVHQLNQLLSKVRMPAGTSDQEKIKQKALDKLIDEALVIQAAQQVKLDRTPEILSALEAAKRKVLVEGYVKRTLQGVGKPSGAEVEAFYNSRPEVFKDRKLFIYTKMTVPVEKDKIDGVVEEIKSRKKVAQVAPMLDKKKISYKTVVEAKTSEALPPVLLKPMSSLKVGDLGYLKMSDGLLIIELQQAINQTVTLEQATPVIERNLFIQKQKEAALKLVESLKAEAVIEYVGEFSPK